CSGTPRLELQNAAGTAVLLGDAVVVGTLTYYPLGPVATIRLASIEQPPDPTTPGDCSTVGGTLTSRGTCCANAISDPNDPNTDSFPTAAAAIADLSGLVPPFHVEGP